MAYSLYNYGIPKNLTKANLVNKVCLEMLFIALKVILLGVWTSNKKNANFNFQGHIIPLKVRETAEQVWLSKHQYSPIEMDGRSDCIAQFDSLEEGLTCLISPGMLHLTINPQISIDHFSFWETRPAPGQIFLE